MSLRKLVSCEIGKLYLILESLKNDQNYMKMSERNQSLFLKKNENFILEIMEPIKFNNDNKNVKNGFWATVIYFNKKYKVNIPKLIKSLAKKNIYSRSFFSPLSTQNGYKNFRMKNLKNRNALDLFNNSILSSNNEFDLGWNDFLYLFFYIQFFV